MAKALTRGKRIREVNRRLVEIGGKASHCGTQSNLTSRLIPLVIHGTAEFDALELDTADWIVWNGASPTAMFDDEVDGDGYADWVGHFRASDVVAGAGSSVFAAALASSQRVLAQPAVSFGAVSDSDGDDIDDNCDQCPGVSGSGAFGCP